MELELKLAQFMTPKQVSKLVYDRLLREFMSSDELVKSLAEQVRALESINYSNADQ
jgi:hypothetical protein